MSRPFNEHPPRTCRPQRPQRKLVTEPSHPLHAQAQPRAPPTASDHPHHPVPPPLAPTPSVAPRDCQIKKNLHPMVLQALHTFPSQLLSHWRLVHEAAVTHTIPRHRVPPPASGLCKPTSPPLPPYLANLYSRSKVPTGIPGLQNPCLLPRAWHPPQWLSRCQAGLCLSIRGVCW